MPRNATDMTPATEGSTPPGNKNPADEVLLAQIEQGNQDALLVLHRRYVNLIYSFTLRILDDSMAAEEVTQDVFMKLWQQPRAYDPRKGRFSSWLLTVARYTAIDRLRQEGRRPPKVPTVDAARRAGMREQTTGVAGPDAERYQHLRMALEQLPADQREAIELAYFGGMSQQDIADHLGLPLGTVKTRIRLGMQKLRAAWLQNP